MDNSVAPYQFVPMQKNVKSPQDIPSWEKSEAYYELIGFLNSVSSSIQGKKISSDVFQSPGVGKVLTVLDKLRRLIEETPPIEQPQRFGNMAYRNWQQKVKENSKDLLLPLLPEDKKTAIDEILVYFLDSFGNETRIDYGTGHELAFIFFLCCLFKLGILLREDQAAVGLKIFDAYLNLVRALQLTYRMEPAGSHGVWSLDDYQFIPFIWGSAQLAMNSPIEPAQFLDENVINRMKNDFMYIGCIDYILKVKTGNFAEHSNQLWSISGVSTWTKINSGLVQMYKKEVLSKFPVIQHVFFGSLMPFTSVKPGTILSAPRLGFVPPMAKPRPLPPTVGDSKPL